MCEFNGAALKTEGRKVHAKIFKMQDAVYKVKYEIKASECFSL